MSLKREIQPYIDAYGLVAPRQCSPLRQGSDNGVMFTSEYFIMLLRNDELLEDDLSVYEDTIDACISDKGLLNRSPVDTDQTGPDDYYGVFAACVELCDFAMGARLLQGIMDCGGYMNNHDGTRTAQSFLIRQPQLLAAAFAAADRAPIWSWPLYGWAALVIATSCIGVPTDNADARRLSWLLIQAAGPKSLACRLAAKLWYRRLYKDYPDGMRGVAKVYYEKDPPHPFTRYWVD